MSSKTIRPSAPLVLAVVLAACTSGAPDPSPETPPNLLVILTDDQGYPTLAVNVESRPPGRTSVRKICEFGNTTTTETMRAVIRV
jgi:hypothetical protein